MGRMRGKKAAECAICFLVSKIFRKGNTRGKKGQSDEEQDQKEKRRGWCRKRKTRESEAVS